MNRYEFSSGHQRLTLKDFEVPPYPKHGDRDVNELYRAIGRSLSQWEMIEITLADLFSNIMHPEGYSVSATYAATNQVIGVLVSSRTRIDVIRESATTLLRALAINELSDRVINQLNTIDRASHRRNEIAHGLVSHFEKYGHAMVPHMHNPRKMHRNPTSLDTLHKYRYSSVEVNALSEKFTLLFKETYNLSMDVSDELRTSVEKFRGKSSRHLEE